MDKSGRIIGRSETKDAMMPEARAVLALIPSRRNEMSDELVIPEDLRFWHDSLCDDRCTYFNAPVKSVRELIERIARAEARCAELEAGLEIVEDAEQGE